MAITKDYDPERDGPKVSSVPQIPQPELLNTTVSRPAVRIADPDIIIFNEQAFPQETIADLFFEQMGGHELISISRNDIVNGQEVSYSLIKNLKGIEQKYNPLNIFSLSETSEKVFKNFSIRFDIHVPDIGTGPLNQRAYVLSESTPIASRGDLVIDVVNMETNERVDIEILRAGQAFSDTMYLEES